MLEKDDGIVLRVTRSGETSQVLTFLGRRTGKVRLIAKGALGTRSPWRGLFEPGRHVEVVYYHKEGRTLYFIKEASARPGLPVRRDSLPHLATMLAAMELLELVCYQGSPDEHIVDVAVDYVHNQHGDDPLFLFLALEIKLLEALGAAPGVSACERCGASVEGGTYSPRDGASYCREHGVEGEKVALDADMISFIERSTVLPFAELAHVRVESRVRKELGKLVHWTYTLHVHGYSLPKSLNLI
jgi:DNA repair protein RecO